ncbi:MAG: hypothetical protein R3F31_10240 [Verrucomicrobiales bacterium]
MNLFRRLFLLTTLLLAPVPSFAQWQAGVGKVDITPTEPVPLAGYGGKPVFPCGWCIPSGSRPWPCATAPG